MATMKSEASREGGQAVSPSFVARRQCKVDWRHGYGSVVMESSLTRSHKLVMRATMKTRARTRG